MRSYLLPLNQSYLLFSVLLLMFSGPAFAESELSERLFSESESVRFAAGKELVRLDSESRKRLAETMVPKLIKQLDNPQNQIWAFTILGQLGDSAYNATDKLLELSNNSHPDIAYMATQYLGTVSCQKDERIVKHLIDILKKPHTRLTEATVIALNNCGPSAELAIPVLTEAIGKMNDGYTKATIAGILGKFGAKAEPSVPVLVEVFETSRPDVQWASVIALRKIGKGLEKHVESLTTGLQHTNSNIQLEVIAILGDLGPAAIKALPALKAASVRSPRFKPKIAEAIHKIEK